MSVTYNIIISPALSVPLPYSFLLPSFPSLLPVPVSNVHRWRPGRTFKCFLEARSKFNTLVALRFILSCLWQSPVPNLNFMCFDSISLEVTSLPVWHLYVPEVATGFIQLLLITAYAHIWEPKSKRHLFQYIGYVLFEYLVPCLNNSTFLCWRSNLSLHNERPPNSYTHIYIEISSSYTLWHLSG